MRAGQSVLMKRVFAVLLAAVLMVALLTGVFFNVFSGKTFSRLTADELLPKARSLAGLIERYQNGEFSADVLSAMVNDSGSGESLLGAYAYAVNAGGEKILTSSLFESAQVKLDQLAASALQGNTVTGNVTMGNTDMYCIAVPVGNNTGAVVLCTAMTEHSAANDIFLYSLLIALVITLPVSFFAMYRVSDRLSKPLKQISRTALAMAEGRLEKTADENAPGEIGEVARSLNKVADDFTEHLYRMVIERDKLTYIIEGISEGIVALDAIGNITMQNTALEKMFAEREPQSDPKLQLIPYKEVWDDFDKAFETHEVSERNLTRGEKILRIVITPIVEANGMCSGIIGLVSDITESERLERTRRDYVANVSHEMRTPLTAMRALIEPLKEGMVKKEEDRQRYYDIMMRETLRLSRLISDLMELSRLQSGTVAIQKSVFDLGELVMDVSDRYASIAREHGETFELLNDFTGCPEVYSNPDRVEQIMVILLDNAIKYTREGGNIAVDAKWDDDKVTVMVKDSGIGISEEDIPHVFDRFYKVDRAHSGNGSGLGLSIARELMHWMGEDIYVNSTIGVGSTFCFTVGINKHDQEEE